MPPEWRGERSNEHGRATVEGQIEAASQFARSANRRKHRKGWRRNLLLAGLWFPPPCSC